MEKLTFKWDKYLFSYSYNKPFFESINLGNGTVLRLFAQFIKNHFLVGIENLSFFAFEMVNRYKHWRYVASKLNLPEPDGRIIADFINEQLNNSNHSISYQGEYCKKYIENIDEKNKHLISPKIILHNHNNSNICTYKDIYGS